MKRTVGIGLVGWGILGLLATSPVRPVLTRNAATTDSTRTDPESGLAVDEQLPLVKGHCTACHSSRLILQSHFSREKWIERIRWMQRTQNLWDLGESEPAVLAYLVKHYGPVRPSFDGRRPALPPVTWSPATN